MTSKSVSAPAQPEQQQEQQIDLGHSSGLRKVSTIPTKEVQSKLSSRSEHLDLPPMNEPSTSMEIDMPPASTSSTEDISIEDCPEYDLGKWVGKSSSLTRSQKMDILKKCWVPQESYDFRKDVMH